MKKLSLIFIAGLISLSSFLSAQTQEENRLSYSIFNEYGLYLAPLSMGKHGMRDQGVNLGFTTVVVNNLVLNKKSYFGLGTGVEFDFANEFDIPVYFNFRHYFKDPSDGFRPMINAALGTRVSVYNDYTYIVPFPSLDVGTKLGLYATFGGGFRARVFSFHASYFFKSGYHSNDMGMEVKVGLVF